MSASWSRCRRCSIQLDELLARVDFLSVGSNDLAQFMFAADRSNTNLAGRFDPISPPFLRALKMIVDKARAADKPVTLCGELASQPIGALALAAIGYRSMSLSASSVGPVKAMMLDLDAAKATALVLPMLDGVQQRHVREKLEAFAAGRGAAAVALFVRKRARGDVLESVGTGIGECRFL